MAAGKEPTLVVNGDGSAVREYTHVGDVADAYRLALGRIRPGTHEVVNIGSGIRASIQEVIESVEDLTGQRLSVQRHPARTEPPALMLDSTRARGWLGWKPEHEDLQRIIRDAWAWFRYQAVGK